MKRIEFNNSLKKSDFGKIKNAFIADDARDENNARCLTVKVAVYGEDYIYNVRYIPDCNIVMTTETIMELEHFDDEIECNPGLYKATNVESAWRVFEAYLKKFFDKA